MRVEMTDTEMGVLLIKARAGNPLPFSFTANGVCTLDSELPEAAWAIAELAVLRAQMRDVRVAAGSPIKPGDLPKRDLSKFPYGSEPCQCGKSAAFQCELCGAGGYSFPAYGDRRSVTEVASILIGTGLVDAPGAFALAEALETRVNVCGYGIVEKVQEVTKPARRPSVSNSVNVGGAMTGSLVQTNEIKGGIQL